MVGAASIGLALTTGDGIAVAEPSATNSAESGPSSSTDSSPSTDGSTHTHASGGPSTAMGASSDPKGQATSSGSGVEDAGADASESTPGTERAAGSSADDDDDSTGDAGTDAADAKHHRFGAVKSSPVAKGTVSPPERDRGDSSVNPRPQAPAVHDGGPAETPTAVDAVSSTPSDLVTKPQPSVAAVPEQVPTAATVPPSDPSPAHQVVTAPDGVIAGVANLLGTPGAPAPVEPPSVWTVLAWVQRQVAEMVAAPMASQQIAASKSTTATTIATVTTINVKEYGAVGDGITDDSAAIKAAVAALTSGERLYLPLGDYRFAQQHPVGEAAIVLAGLSNVTVEFEPGARLLMDNLDSNGYGTSHGIRVQGAASHVAILNPTIEWVTRPSARSFGDGISVLGWPSDSPPPAGWVGSTGTVDFVSIINGRTVNAPQAGAVIMGASDVTVTNFTAIGTLADGLHFNADRRVTVDGLVAVNTGDDGLAFVTYYDPSQLWTYGPTDGPFNQAGVGAWNNGGSVASHIFVTGGRANGVRVQGGYDITISDITVTDKDFGIQLNSAKATGPGDWTSLASRDVHVSDVTIDGAQTAIVLATNNIDGTEDPMWWDFAGSSISDVTITGAKNWSLAVETPATITSKFAGITLRHIRAESMAADGPFGGGNGGILLASLHDSVIDDVQLVSDHSGDINLLGAGQLRSALSAEDLPSSNLDVNDLVLRGPGRILIQDIAGVHFGNVASYGADSSAVILYRVKGASFDHIGAYMPGRGSGEGYGVRLLQVFDIDIQDIEVTIDDHIGTTWRAIELGGGTPTGDIAGRGVRIANVTYVSERDATGSDIVWQGGPYGPVDWFIQATWRHGGEATPQWRSALYGDTSPV